MDACINEGILRRCFFLAKTCGMLCCRRGKRVVRSTLPCMTRMARGDRFRLAGTKSNLRIELRHTLTSIYPHLPTHRKHPSSNISHTTRRMTLSHIESASTELYSF